MKSSENEELGKLRVLRMKSLVYEKIGGRRAQRMKSLEDSVEEVETGG